MNNDHDPSELTPSEEAQQIVDNIHNGVAYSDDVYPWWRTLRRPLQLISIAVALLCVGVIFLSITLKNILDDRQTQTERDNCYSLFVNAAAESAQIVRKAASEVSNHGWDTLVNAYVTGEVPDGAVDELQVLIDEAERANAVDESVVNARTEWLEDGRPLPCPINENDPLAVPGTEEVVSSVPGTEDA